MVTEVWFIVWLLKFGAVWVFVTEIWCCVWVVTEVWCCVGWLLKFSAVCVWVVTEVYKQI